MGKLKITDEDIRALKFQANLVYKVLEEAVSAGNKHGISSAEILCRYDLGGYLFQLVSRRDIKDIGSLKKPGTRGKEIEKFLLQYFIMCEVDSESERPKVKMVARDFNDGMGGLKAIIDAEDPRNPENDAGVYRLLSEEAGRLRRANQFVEIVAALKYVREKYL